MRKFLQLVFLTLYLLLTVEARKISNIPKGEENKFPSFSRSLLQEGLDVLFHYLYKEVTFSSPLNEQFPSFLAEKMLLLEQVVV